ncbi:hypothetical protein F8144_23390 [Streptomyces triticiradicis]|uniref:DUF11 domain-containing protein n=1 Tax=Streptomyces triticiradicis TaxID=2651189 RepID=A0A7J5DCV5_9ACTN|nr:hypothetical protein F8144_23390 [Streptomyces triticiradicis]
MSSLSVGRVLRRGLCAGAVGALVLTGFGSGAAFAGGTAQGDELAIRAPQDTVITAAPESGAAQYRSLVLGLTHSNRETTVTDGRLTVDVSGLAGVAEVAWPDNCAPDDTGTVAVCDTGDVPNRYSPQVRLKVRATAEAGVGAQGAIEYSAEATGGPDGALVAPGGSTRTFVTVASGVDLGVSAPQDVTGVAPGSSLTVPFSVTNTGNETAHGFKVSMWATYGLDVATRYPQCTSTGPGSGGFTHVTCSFDTDVPPGATVELPEPLRLAVTGHALYERFEYGVEPADEAVVDLDSSDNNRTWHINADNTADFSVKGAKASGAAGDTVTTAFRFINNGPAWAGDVTSGDPLVAIDFYLPEGTTATSVPRTCRTTSAPGDAPNTVHYVCTLPTWTTPDLDVSFPFQLRVDRVVPDATGRVVARSYSGAASLPFDPDTTNNSAEVVVNPSV